MSEANAMQRANRMVWRWIREHHSELFADDPPSDAALQPAHARLAQLLHDDQAVYDFIEMRRRGRPPKSVLAATSA